MQIFCILAAMPQNYLTSSQSQVMQMVAEKSEAVLLECTSNVSIGIGHVSVETVKSVPRLNDPIKTLAFSKAADFSKVADSSKCAESTKSLPVGTLKNSPHASIYWSKGSCTVQFERRFIEVDDELVSVITDIEGITLV